MAGQRDLYRSASDEAEIRRWCAERLAGWPVAHTRTLVDTSWGPTQLSSAGGGETTCVYLPGTAFNAATSLAVLAALAERCRVVCADLPGQPGGSSATHPPDDPDAWGTWVGQVVEHARAGSAGRVVLAGHSRGGAAALTCPPDLVDALVLVAPAGLAAVKVSAATLVRSAAWLLRPTPRRSARLVDLMAGRAPLPDRTALAEWMTLVARSTRPTGAPGPLPRAVLERWRGADVRVLVGEDDVFFPPRRLRGPVAERTGAAVQVVTRAGHLLPDQQPDLVAAAVA